MTDSILVTTDLHLTDRERDAYRWDLFPWLEEQAKEEGDKHLLILGDLTDEKDGHSARLVNRIVDTLTRFVSLGMRVWILKGNHDYIDPDCPYFRFLNMTHGIRFLHKPVVGSIGQTNTAFLPHSRNPVEEWQDFRMDDASMVVCHQTFNGADAGKGHRLDGGISSRYFSDERNMDLLVLSGDIHVPQQCGDVTYVGCPYPISFGDAFEPRVIRIQDSEGAVEYLSPPSIRKWSLDLTRS